MIKSVADQMLNVFSRLTQTSLRRTNNFRGVAPAAIFVLVVVVVVVVIVVVVATTTTIIVATD